MNATNRTAYVQSGGLHTHNIIVLDRGDYTSCTINLHGATVTSWRINNREMIFISRECHFTGLSPIRGGIQFMFPVVKGYAMPNGFAKFLSWHIMEGPATLENGDVYALVSLINDAYTQSLWGFEFQLFYKITLYEKKIEFTIGVENSSDKMPLEFNIVQHSLMRVNDVTKCEILGLRDCKYFDCVRNIYSKEERKKITISDFTDIIYINAPDDVVVTNTIGDGELHVKKKMTRDIQLWNPWIEKSKTITNLGDDEYMNFIAVQTGIVMKPVRIEPLSCWQAFQIFEYVEPRKETVVGDLYDIFNGYC